MSGLSREAIENLGSPLAVRVDFHEDLIVAAEFWDPLGFLECILLAGPVK